jgi:hypothetical protein
MRCPLGMTGKCNNVFVERAWRSMKQDCNGVEYRLRNFKPYAVVRLADTLLETVSPELRSFAVEVYATCVLGKIRKPDPPLNQAWIVPGGGYDGQWLWDTPRMISFGPGSRVPCEIKRLAQVMPLMRIVLPGNG